jgi:hypothetical protein
MVKERIDLMGIGKSYKICSQKYKEPLNLTLDLVQLLVIYIQFRIFRKR